MMSALSRKTIHRSQKVLVLTALTLLLGSCGYEELEPLDHSVMPLGPPPQFMVLVRDYCPTDGFVLSEFYATNVNAVLHRGFIRQDSDYDGLPDIMELDPSVKTNPKAKDSNSDGYSDLLIYLSGFDRDAEADLRICESRRQDTDHDGLSDCEENNLLHTDANDPDTDRDGIPDATEIRNRLNPSDAADAVQDQDGDGYNNISEIRMNTPIDEAHNEYYEQIAYRYRIVTNKDRKQEDQDKTAVENPRPHETAGLAGNCYDLAVDKIPLMPETASNLVCFHFMERRAAADQRLETPCLEVPEETTADSTVAIDYRELSQTGEKRQ